MQRFLKIVSWGLVIWGLTLVLPSISIMLSPKVVDALVVGLVVAISALFLGQHFTPSLTESHDEGDQANQAPDSRPTRPVLRVKRDSRTTRPIPELTRPGLGSLVNQPVPATPERLRRSPITRPMPIAR